MPCKPAVAGSIHSFTSLLDETLSRGLMTLAVGGRLNSNTTKPSLVLVQASKTHPHITERLLMGHKESNHTKNKQRQDFS